MTTGRRAVRLGLTGPIGCGKSTVAGWIGEREDALVIDADLVARSVLASGRPELAAVYRRFGPNLQRPDGSLDRGALGRIVFADPDALRDLEAIVHPAVRMAIREAIADADASGVRIVVIEAIKLVEGGLADECDGIWLVTCSSDVQADRLASRGMPPDEATARVVAQGDIGGSVAPRATAVIDTSGSPEATQAAVDAGLEALLAEVSPTA
jgi:dephospho-CoA kinase